MPSRRPPTPAPPPLPAASAARSMAWRVISSCALAVKASASAWKVVDSALARSPVTRCRTRGSAPGRLAGLPPAGRDGAGSPGAGPKVGRRGRRRTRASVSTATLTPASRGVPSATTQVPEQASPAATSVAPMASSCIRQRADTSAAW